MMMPDKPAPTETNHPWPIWGVALAMLLFVTLFRVVRLSLGLEFLPNFSPLMAAAFCAGMFLPGVLALTIPAVALIASDLAVNAVYGVGWFDSGMPVRLLLYLGAAGLGMVLRANRFRLFPVLGGVLGSALAFYLVTNTSSWISNPGYAKSLAGWVQALTVGLPGLPPTWVFFRNAVVSSLLFTALFYAVLFLAARPQVREARHLVHGSA